MLILATILLLIGGRDEVLDREVVRRPVYRAIGEEYWKVLEPEGSIADTMKANLVIELEEEVKLTVYSFPDDRILPEAQIARWQRQAGGSGTMKWVARSGFSGLQFEAPGVLAWAMQLDHHHYQALTLAAENREEWEHYKQMRADYTIKVVGPQEKVDRHREAIDSFAQSFELIQEVPCF